MHTSNLLLLPLIALLSPTLLCSPVHSDDHQATLHITIDSIDTSADVGVGLAPVPSVCGKINGNCFQNQCRGEFSEDRQTCTTGTGVKFYYCPLFYPPPSAG